MKLPKEMQNKKQNRKEHFKNKKEFTGISPFR